MSDQTAVDRTTVDEQILAQYQHIKELALLKYNSEEAREDSLIRQSSQMQTAFSFMTAAIFMPLPVLISYSSLPKQFLLISTAFIVLCLLTSLVLASFVQWRYTLRDLPAIPAIKAAVLDDPNWEQFIQEYNRIDQLVNALGEIQAHKAQTNEKRVTFLVWSMLCFYLAILALLISFVIGIVYIIIN